MELQFLFPADVTIWLTKYGLFLALCFFIVLFVLLLLRPFWMWFSGQSEANERLRKIVELNQKTLTELEILNKTLSIPIRKAAKRTTSEETSPPEPLVLSQDKKEEFLRALEHSRKVLKNEESSENEGP